MLKNEPLVSFPFMFGKIELANLTGIQQFLHRVTKKFSHFLDNTLYEDMNRLLVLCGQEFLSRRDSKHIARMVCAQHFIRKTFFRSLEDSDTRFAAIRFLPSTLFFPFLSKPVLGLMIGVSLKDKYELFTEEHLIRAVQKIDPQAKFVQGSVYSYQENRGKLKIIYLELEKNGAQKLQRKILKGELKLSIERVSPSVFMLQNEEDILKTILTLSQEVTSPSDLPQAVIHLEEQREREVIFKVILLYVAQEEKNLQKLFQAKKEIVYSHERTKTVKYLKKKYSVQASVFHLHLSKTPDLLRADASLNFYLTRKKISHFLQQTLGDFRDYNGSIISQQQNTFLEFKELFAVHPLDLLENFFYAISPLEAQAIISVKTLTTLFTLILESFKDPLPQRGDYFLQFVQEEHKTFVVFRAKENGFQELFQQVVHFPSFPQDFFIQTKFSAQDSYVMGWIFESPETVHHQAWTEALKSKADEWRTKVRNLQVLRFPVQFTLFSLDPRIGGDEDSKIILKLLFEGLMRIDPKGQVVPGLAKSVAVSADGKHYTFKLRKSYWSNGDLVLAADFVYAWKTVLSPEFKTPIAYLFYPIKNAKAVKKNFVSPDLLGVHATDEATLQVELEYPIPYFLELLAHTQFSPVNARVDRLYPNWSTQAADNYICNGAFLMKQNDAPYAYQLVKNRTYWDADQIHLDQVKIVKTNLPSAIQLFQDNKLDWIRAPLNMNHFPTLNAMSDKMIFLPNEFVYWYNFNTRVFPFYHTKLRQSLALVVNRAEILQHLSGVVWPAFTPLPTTHSRAIFMNEDQEKAIQMFEEVLQELGLKRETFPPIHLLCLQEKNREKITELLAKNWEKTLGIRCFIKTLEWRDLLKSLHEGTFEMALSHWTASIDDPSYTLAIFRDVEESINYPKWENKTYQTLFDKGQQEKDLNRRLTYFSQAEELLVQEVPVIPIARVLYGALQKNHLCFNTRASFRSWDLKWASIKKKENI